MFLRVLICALGFLSTACSTAELVEETKTSTCAADSLAGSEFFKAELARAASPHVIVVAHRGCWSRAPENSLRGIEACIALGIDMIEIDVRKTADGALVLMHDETLERTTNGSGDVSQMSLAEITSLRLKTGAGGDHARLTGDSVPTLEEALVIARGEILINIDAKDDVIAASMELVEGLGMTDQVLMKSAVPSSRIMAATTSVRGRAAFMPIVAQSRTGGRLSSIIDEYRATDPVAFEVLFDDIAWFEEGTDDLEAQGFRAWVNTMKPIYSAGLTDARSEPSAVWGQLVRSGADMIQTDAPEEALQYLESIGRRCN